MRKITKENIKKNFIYLKKELKYKEKEPKREIISNIHLSKEELKDIYNIKSLSNIENIKYNGYQERGVSWQEEVVCQYNFFITMLGVIDSRLDYIKRDSYKDKNWEKELLILRNEVVGDFLNTYNKAYLAPDFIVDIIQTCPSYNRFNELYDDLKENYYSLVLQLRFIDAYNFGYENSLYFKPEDIINEYRKFYADLNISINKNKKREAIIKQKYAKNKN